MAEADRIALTATINAPSILFLNPIAEDDKVVAIGRYTAEHGETGKSMDIPFVHVWTVKDGRITAFQQYTDTLTHTDVMQAD